MLCFFKKRRSTNLISVWLWNFKDGGSKKVSFLAKNRHPIKDFFLNSGDELWMVHQKLGIILENKVVQKLSLEKNVFTKKWSPKLIFLNDFFLKKIR